MTTTVTITWNQPDERPLGREDSAWYTWDSAHNLVATVSNGERSIDIFADGEMRVLVHEGENASGDYAVVRYADRLAEHGITNDADLAAATDTSRIVWDNNPWFDLYADDKTIGEDGWLNCVCDTLTEAVERATELLGDDDLWTEGK